eukprot:TRINITY_DN27104_c0_g1_i1.p1 TRINITY_DN27104_c0_g1~~TRINITY_DN27104_c0_g1_i1.p1  ORF type:complete len:370 (+),score=86.04 TRINITY_DN27104_c0_g1_i1:240-1349(+)
MDRWAASGKYHMNFVCACVMGDSSARPLSRQFANELKLQHVTNGFIDNNNDMPKWGQLGCSGFIVLDEKHEVVCKATSAFMEVRELAFRHVEAILDALAEKRPLPRFCPGEFVRIADVGSHGVSGVQGICLKIDGDMHIVQLLNGPMRNKQVKVPAEALLKPGEAIAPAKQSSGGCSTGNCGPAGGLAGSCGPGGCGPAQEKTVCNDGSCGTKAGCCDTQGGCDSNGAGCDDTVLDKDFLSITLKLPSVQVPSMDKEHEHCAQLLEELVAQKSAAALQRVFDCFEEHFAHEEALFDEFGFGEHQNERLSAKKSHKDDHTRLLSKIRQQLSSQSIAVAPAFVREVIEDFHEHATKYDVMYGDHLHAKGAM